MQLSKPVFTGLKNN